MRVEAVAAEGKNSLSVRAGIIESVWTPGSFVDVEDAKDAMLAVERISGGMPMPMLSEMTDVEISAAARYEFAQTTGVLAIAVLGSSAVDRVVAAAMSR
ncbi:MAG TPA: STAS/SEC14 domain-containing protein, partial [Arthrobacter sp.]|nr:STAS/SEC14 domain-containing protein [Arthrobacter sp.]